MWQEVKRPKITNPQRPDALIQTNREQLQSHAQSWTSDGQSRSDLSEIMNRRMQQQFLEHQIPTAENEADRLAANAAGAQTMAQVKAQMVEAMGADFSSVRFHTGPEAVSMADQMGARAYTTGKDVYFGAGGFNPTVAAHELVHTAQQGSIESSMETVSAPAGEVQMWHKGNNIRRKSARFDSNIMKTLLDQEGKKYAEENAPALADAAQITQTAPEKPKMPSTKEILEAVTPLPKADTNAPSPAPGPDAPIASEEPAAAQKPAEKKEEQFFKPYQDASFRKKLSNRYDKWTGKHILFPEDSLNQNSLMGKPKNILSKAFNGTASFFSQATYPVRDKIKHDIDKVKKNTYKGADDLYENEEAYQQLSTLNKISHFTSNPLAHLGMKFAKDKMTKDYEQRKEKKNSKEQKHAEDIEWVKTLLADSDEAQALFARSSTMDEPDSQEEGNVSGGAVQQEAEASGISNGTASSAPITKDEYHDYLKNKAKGTINSVLPTAAIASSGAAAVLSGKKAAKALDQGNIGGAISGEIETVSNGVGASSTGVSLAGAVGSVVNLATKNVPTEVLDGLSDFSSLVSIAANTGKAGAGMVDLGVALASKHGVKNYMKDNPDSEFMDEAALMNQQAKTSAIEGGTKAASSALNVIGTGVGLGTGKSLAGLPFKAAGSAVGNIGGALAADSYKKSQHMIANQTMNLDTLVNEALRKEYTAEQWAAMSPSEQHKAGRKVQKALLRALGQKSGSLQEYSLGVADQKSKNLTQKANEGDESAAGLLKAVKLHHTEKGEYDNEAVGKKILSHGGKSISELQSDLQKKKAGVHVSQMLAEQEAEKELEQRKKEEYIAQYPNSFTAKLSRAKGNVKGFFKK